MEKESKTSVEGKNDRQVGPEILRCIAMMMVIVLHFLWKGGLLKACESDMSDTTALAWILESFSATAVNIYVLISGYFLYNSSFKIKRLFRLIIQVWFYSFVIGILSIKFALYPVEAINAEFLLTVFFPLLNRHYWFVTEYLKLYIMLPILGVALQRITDQTLKRILIVYFTFFCLLKSFFPVRMSDDRSGYDWLWFLFIFFLAVYIKRKGVKLFFKNKIQAFAVYVICSSAIFIMSRGIGEFIKKGLFTDSTMLFIDYNHLLVLLAAVGLFSVFIQIEGKVGVIGTVCKKIGKYTLGVYLLHENLGIRYIWPYFFGAGNISSPLDLVKRLTLGVVVIFTLGIFVEFIRCSVENRLFSLLGRISLFKKISYRLDEWDKGFALTKDDII